MVEANTKTPTTPAELAAAILDAIEKAPDAFDMTSWVSIASASGATLSPTAEPRCGTTMCVAGWAAHLLGWTLVEGMATPVRLNNGSELLVCVYAVKDGNARLVEEVAHDALGPGVSFYASSDEALAQLREIAGR
ncbi:hypothetical protein AB0P17_36510 [Streptomyces sp. NPDC088124]|uniref:hypothetical protein n=1 Tax=Streptomyces sp. NPDC088124 TaxID=3154654 RepID=UPI00342C8E35